MRSLDEMKDSINAAVAASDTDTLHILAQEALAHGTKEAEAIAEHIRGLAATITGDAPQSLLHFQRALTLWEELNDRKGVARANGNIGNKYINMGDGKAALVHFQRALDIMEDLDDRLGIARTLGNIGNVYIGNGEYATAMEYYRRSMAIHVDINNSKGVAIVLGNIGTLHLYNGEYAASLEHYHRAIDMHEQQGDRYDLARVLNSIGNVYESLGDYPRALEYYRRSMEIYEVLGDRNGVAMAVANIGLVYADTGDNAAALENYREALSVYEQVNDRPGAAVVVGNMGSVYGNMGDHSTALDHFRRALVMCRELEDRASMTRVMGRIVTALCANGDVSAARDMLAQQSEYVIDNPEVSTERQLNLAMLCEQVDDVVGGLDHLQQALSIASEAGLRSQVADCHKHLRDLALKRNDLPGYVEHNNEYTRITEEIRGKEATQRMAMMEAERKVEGERREREKERALLYGALPRAVADRMIRGEKVTGDHYDEATVIFADIVGFTQISEQLSPGDVVMLLEKIFSAFDAVCEQHNVTKIKTIGDSYMAVSFDNVMNAVHCALEFNRIQYTIQNTEFDPAMVQFRIGMHCGPVTAGVIGTQRLQYDVWGDTVNVASRMESSGSPGRCHATRAVVDAIASGSKDQGYRVEERGEVDVKGKGLMHTYWLEGMA